MSRWNEREDVPRGDTYDETWRKLEASGVSIHGEADLISSFKPESVLDAGCGTGRIAIELAARGLNVVGTDLDPAMLSAALDKAPSLRWIEADLATVKVHDDEGAQQLFDIVAMPGNVMIFLDPGSEAQVVENMAAHLAPGGLLIAGFTVSDERLPLHDYDAYCEAQGLSLQDRWSTWDREPFVAGGTYAVSVHAARG